MLTYLYVCCVTRINLVILHIFMYNVISDLDNIYMHMYRMSPYSTGCNYDKGQSVKHIYMLAYLYVCCVTRINLVILHIFMYNVISDLDNIYMHMYRMSPYSTGCNYDKGQSVKHIYMLAYLYVCCVTRINLVILHIFMYNVISDLDNIYMHIYRMSPYSTGCNYDKGQSVKGDHVVFYLVFN